MPKSLLFLLGILFSIHTLQAQYRGSALGNDLYKALQQGSADILSPYIDSRTDLWYQSRLRAGAPETILFSLKRFFQENHCVRLSVLNESTIQGMDVVKTDYRANNGNNFVVTFIIRDNKLKRIKIIEK